jgi:predicted MFS family arabinose efflux permease
MPPDVNTPSHFAGDLAPPAPRPLASGIAPVLLLAVGTFAIGTESFMIAPLLPDMAADLDVSVGAVGQLVTAFTLTYALTSPVLTMLTGRLDRRLLLALSMAVFAAANAVAALSSHYLGLLGARVLLAVAAGLYAPNANALAGTLVPPALRGRALAVVNGGTTVAIALGVPLGGHQLGWRMTFVAVGVLAALAVAGLLAGLPRGLGAGAGSAGIGERLAMLRRPAIGPSLLVTLFWAMGAYTVYTYLAPIVGATTDLPAAWIPALVLLWGVSAGIGLVLGGLGNDRLGANAVVLPSLAVLAAAFAALSACAVWLSPSAATPAVIPVVVLWGVSVWSFFPAQQAKLIGLSGPEAAPVVLSLNASFMFLGFSIGAALGGATLARASAGAIGWAGAGCECVALLLALCILPRGPAQRPGYRVE